MIVYNITSRIDPGIETEWVKWQRDIHIPEILALGLFTDYKLYRLLDQDESEGITYVIQLYAQEPSLYERFINEFDAAMRNKALLKWGNKFIEFRTAMQIVN
jgi:hypothetical protein